MTTHPQTFQEILLQGMSKHPERVALVSPGQSLRYRDLAERSARVAGALQERGITEGDRVAVLLPNSWEFIVAFFGVVLAGGIVVPFDPGISPERFETLARDCGVRALVLDQGVLPRLQASIIPAAAWQVVLLNEGAGETNGLGKELPILPLREVLGRDPNLAIYRRRAPNPEIVVSINYTGSEQGEPKGVMHTHQSWLCGAELTSTYLQAGPGGKVLVLAPLPQAGSFRVALAYLAAGGTVITAPSLAEAGDLFRAAAPDALLVETTAIDLLVQALPEWLQARQGWLNLILAEPVRLAGDQIGQLRAQLPEVRVILPYSPPEAAVGFLVTVADPSEQVIKAIQPGLDLRVVNKRGNHVFNGQIGEIVIRGAGLMAGYWGSTLGEARRYRQWGFATGDLGRVLPDGSILLVGKAEKPLSLGRVNGSLEEIEHVINLHPGVLRAAIFSVASPEGQPDAQLTAQVVLKKGVYLSAESLLHYCRERLEPEKVPAEIRFCNSLNE